MALVRVKHEIKTTQPATIRELLIVVDKFAASFEPAEIPKCC